MEANRKILEWTFLVRCGLPKNWDATLLLLDRRMLITANGSVGTRAGARETHRRKFEQLERRSAHKRPRSGRNRKDLASLATTPSLAATWPR
eukprot:7100878-Pyramimonas_sp.AAC.1